MNRVARAPSLLHVLDHSALRLRRGQRRAACRPHGEGEQRDSRQRRNDGRQAQPEGGHSPNHASQVSRSTRQGVKYPCARKRVFGVVLATPSAPPSKTSTRPSCQIERVPSLIVFGTSASAVVST